jgi:hypothetical protein
MEGDPELGGIDCVGGVVASLATGHCSMHLDVFSDVGIVVCQVMAVAGYLRRSVATLQTRRCRLRTSQLRTTMEVDPGLG